MWTDQDDHTNEFEIEDSDETTLRDISPVKSASKLSTPSTSSTHIELRNSSSSEDDYSISFDDSESAPFIIEEDGTSKASTVSSSSRWSKFKPSERTRSLLVVYAVVFVDMLGVGLIFPLVPFFALKLEADAFWIGVIYSSYSVFNFIGSIFLGRVSDSYGRKKVLLFGLLGSSIGYVILGFSKSLWHICLARAISGVSGGTIPVGQAYIADVTKAEERAKYMGYLGAAYGIGMILGPAVGGQLGRFGFHTVGFVTAGICTANLLFGAFVMKEATHREPRAIKFSHLKAAVAHREILFLVIAQFCALFAEISMEVMLAVLSVERYKFNEAMLAGGYTLWGASVAIAQIMVALLLKKLKEKQIALMGFAGLTMFLCAFPFVPANLIPMVYVLVSLGGVFDGFRAPTMSTLVTFQAKAHNFGFVLGVYQAFGQLASAMAPSVAGLLYDKLSYRAPFLFGGCLTLIAGILVTFVPAEIPKRALSPPEKSEEL
eukprot:TRINITY_DN7240_c0_g1_i1.p1 TRINITY_DN7240_c0_g1~~TRINITY_DN7240_c0_g1_i1.p1  ORF type:complete len:489 (-),score=48.84 TRINITY_DN7240_c0_g1_i1:10-1476(-)